MDQAVFYPTGLRQYTQPRVPAKCTHPGHTPCKSQEAACCAECHRINTCTLTCPKAANNTSHSRSCYYLQGGK